MSYERLYMVSDFWDCPRGGVADFQGRPHIFQCQFSEVDDDWTDLFWLMEIDQELCALAKEQQAIFDRWLAEFKLGNVSLDTHAPLPADRARDEELRNLIGDRLRLKPERSVTRRGLFVSDRATSEMMVKWTIP